MNEYPSTQGITTVPGIIEYMRQVTRLRGEDVREIRHLNTRLVQGRLRTDRTAPASNADVQASDKEGDIVRSATYEYLLVNDSGNLKWARHAIDVTW